MKKGEKAKQTLQFQAGGNERGDVTNREKGTEDSFEGVFRKDDKNLRACQGRRDKHAKELMFHSF